MNTNAIAAVVPGYYLVCYNRSLRENDKGQAVVPGYYLVCYNFAILLLRSWIVVVPGYYLVCYNNFKTKRFKLE